MKTLQTVLANLIRSGKVKVEIPDLDMDALRKAVKNEAERKLEAIEEIVYQDDMREAERIVRIQMCLEE